MCGTRWDYHPSARIPSLESGTARKPVLELRRVFLRDQPVFRPCIDLHDGKVKQIVGGTLGDEASRLRTNFVSDRPASWFAELYKRDGLRGGHVIMLGPGNEAAARDALGTYPGGLHVGGGLHVDNARIWLDAGA